MNMLVVIVIYVVNQELTNAKPYDSDELLLWEDARCTVPRDSEAAVSPHLISGLNQDCVVSFSAWTGDRW